MALLFMDGFDVGDYALKWVTAGDGGASVTTSTTTRFNTGRSLLLPYWARVVKTIPASSKVFVGVAWRFHGGDYAMRVWGDNGVTNHLSVYITGTTISLRLGTTPIASGLYNWDVGAWHYIELSATIADSGGTAKVRIDGVELINFVGDTKNGGTATAIDSITLGPTDSSYTGSGPSADDFYILDDSGSAPNNDFLGDVRVQTLLPTGAGASTQWTPSVGNNWDNVNDAPYSAATYNSANEVGFRDTYAMSDVNGATGTIFGVQANLLALKTDSGSANLKHVVRSGGTDYYGADRVLGTSLGSYVAVREVDPATDATWDNAGINAVEFGMEVV